MQTRIECAQPGLRFNDNINDMDPDEEDSFDRSQFKQEHACREHEAFQGIRSTVVSRAPAEQLHDRVKHVFEYNNQH
jgi:hypothetical protein